ncbi:MAG: hypothetical protein QOI32_2330 [Thermoleophilaceae bacterium]|nr:hypothetical protein [Thermoleophilaceae bacterium]
MARGFSALPFVLLFALPAGAEAASKRVSVPVPASGDVSFTQYRVTTKAPGKATIVNARRLGDLRIDVVGRRIGGRRYEVTVFALNPSGRASAAQSSKPVIELSSAGDVGARQTAAAINVLTETPTAGEASAIERFCKRPRNRRRTFFSSRRFLSRRNSPVRNFRFQAAACQDRPDAETVAAQRLLAALGADPPACMGSARRYGDLANEIDARLICSAPTRAIGLRAATGNNGMDCLGPAGSACACGPACVPFPPESGCFQDTDGFATNTRLNFRVAWEGPIQPREITAIWVPQGSPVVGHKFAYLRYVLDP